MKSRSRFSHATYISKAERVIFDTYKCTRMDRIDPYLTCQKRSIFDDANKEVFRIHRSRMLEMNNLIITYYDEFRCLPSPPNS